MKQFKLALIIVLLYVVIPVFGQDAQIFRERYSEDEINFYVSDFSQLEVNINFESLREVANLLCTLYEMEDRCQNFTGQEIFLDLYGLEDTVYFEVCGNSGPIRDDILGSICIIDDAGKVLSVDEFDYEDNFLLHVFVRIREDYLLSSYVLIHELVHGILGLDEDHAWGAQYALSGVVEDYTYEDYSLIITGRPLPSQHYCENDPKYCDMEIAVLTEAQYEMLREFEQIQPWIEIIQL